MRFVSLIVLIVAASLVPHTWTTAATPEEAPSPAPPRARVYSVEASKPAVLAEEALRIELVDVKDERCPAELRCIWEGHAAVTLQVTQAESTATTIVIGTPEPSEVKLPSEADVGAYRIGLVRLDPRNSSRSKPALNQYKVTVRVTKR